MISPETIQAVQSAAHIQEVVEDFLPLKKKGQNLWACCPFHHEKTPSFAVNPSKGFYKCFGCDAAGNAISFVKAIEGVSFVEAVKYLAKKYGIPVQETAAHETQLQAQHERDSLYIVLKLAGEYYTDILWHHPEGQRVGQAYCQERGFAAPFIKQFELGYSLDTWQGFYQYAQQKGYSDELLAKAGLISQKGGKTYDRFRGRMMFPIHDTAGQVIAFGARILTAAADQPKYINSPETPIYHKSDVLYGIYQAKQKIRQADHCFLVEGYTDVIALHMAGIANVVAASGTSLTEAQIQLISRFTKHITILFDGDTAGLKAALRSIDMVLAKGLDVKIVLLPAGADPDSYARQVGSTALQTYLQTQAQDFITCKTQLLMQGAQDDPIQKAGAIKEIVQSIAVIPDTVKRALLVRQCSRLMDIAEGVLLAEQNKFLLQRTKEQQRSRTSLRSHEPTMALATRAGSFHLPGLEASIEGYERESIRLLLNYGTSPMDDGRPLCEYLLQELADVTFQTPIYRQILALYQQQLAQGQAVDATYFIQNQHEDIQKMAIDLTAARHSISEQWEERYQICVTKEEDNLNQTVFKDILRLKLRLIHQLMDENKQELQANPAPAEEDRLLQVHTTLKQAEAAIAQQLGIVIMR
ncbi:MAG: DNA primase [Bacteroidota bacterium]